MNKFSNFQNKINNWISKKWLILLSLIWWYQNGISQNLKLNEKEKVFAKNLDKFIDSWYKCESLDKTWMDFENLIDAEWLLNEQEEDQIEQAIEDLKTKHHAKIMLITKDNMTKNGSMNDFGVWFANCVGIWLKNVNNGILIQLDLKDRQARIEQWRTVEGILTASECGEITDSGVPYLRNGDIKWGIDAMLLKLDILLTPEEIKVLTKAELDEQKRQEEENKLILMNILYTLAGAWILWAAGYYIIKEKSKFNNQIKQYNKYIEKTELSRNEFSNNIISFWSIKEELINLRTEERYKDEKNNLIKKSNKIPLNINYNKELQPLSNSRFEFSKNYGKYMENKLSISKDFYANINTSNQFIKECTHEIEDFFNSLRDIKEYQKAGISKTEYLKNINHRINELIKSNYIFSSYIEWFKKNVNNVNKLHEEIHSDQETFSKKVKSISDQNKLYDEIVWNHQALNNMVIMYESWYKNLENIMINKIDYSQYNDILWKLTQLIPEDILKNYMIDITWIQENSKILYNSFQESYNIKNIEESFKKYNDLKDYRFDFENKISSLKNYIKELQNAKEKIPNILSKLIELSDKAEKSIHRKYTNDIWESKKDLNNYKIKLSNQKLNWIVVLDELIVLENIFTQIINKSKNEFSKELEEEKRKKEEEESRKRRLQESSSIWSSSFWSSNGSSSSWSSNFWWWSFWWWGGWSSW